MNTNAQATVELHEQAQFSSLADLDIQELETRLADLPELERRRLIDRAIRMRQAEMRRLADAARREVRPRY